jgi:L(+)-tartrate dehydratase alpha subunit
VISNDLLVDSIYQTITQSSCQVPNDIHDAFESSIKSETSETSKKALESTLESLNISMQRNNLACPDTGWPLFFCKIGNETTIEGGIANLERVAKEMVAKATKAGFLRSTMKHPLTLADPGTNVGENVPGFTYKFVPGDTIEITYVAKGGGSECFGGTRYRVVALADGVTGIGKFIIESYIAAARAGAICPPAIVGVGIGGSADITMSLAKKAACLRTIGSRHPDPDIAKIEDDLYNAMKILEIGAMGSGGKTSVFAVNVEYAYTHLAGITVAMSCNCMISRRATSRLYSDDRFEMLDAPNWFDGR